LSPPACLALAYDEALSALSPLRCRQREYVTPFEPHFCWDASHLPVLDTLGAVAESLGQDCWAAEAFYQFFVSAHFFRQIEIDTYIKHYV
jgi:hypothetical protein